MSRFFETGKTEITVILNDIKIPINIFEWVKF